MKKVLLILLLVVLFFVSSCNQNQTVPQEEVKHNHTWSSGVVSKPRTCKENGEMYQVCIECGEIRCIEIKSSDLSHAWDEGKLESTSTRSIDSNTSRILTCTECGEKHKTLIPIKEESFFSVPINIIIPYRPGGGTYIIAEEIKNVANKLTPYEDVSIISKTKQGGDCMGAAEYLLSEGDHSSEVFIFPYEFFYRTDEDAVRAQEKIIPVISISETPFLLFTKEGRFQNFNEFVEEFRGKTIKVAKTQQDAINFKSYHLSSLAKCLEMTIEYIDGYYVFERAIEGLEKGDIDVYASVPSRATDPILQNKVDALAVFDDSDYLVTDGKDVRIIPNIIDLGYPEASFEMGHVIAMNKDELESKKIELINAIKDVMLTSTMRSQLGYIINPGELNGEKLISVIEINKKKASI